MRWLSELPLARGVPGDGDRRPGSGYLAGATRSGDTGAVAMLVAIFLGTGVLLGLGAITIDTGSLLHERRQLQNGADAAALAIARKCVDADKLGALCGAADVSASTAALVTLAGANAGDQRSDIASVCASAALVAANPAAFSTLCVTLPGPGLVDCPTTTSAAKYVEVRTSTRSGDSSSTILPPILAQTLAGGGYTGETVKACARAGWGPAASGRTAFPVTFSYCDWLAKTGANPLAVPPVLGTYVPPPAAGLNPGYGASPNTPWPAESTQVTFYTAGNGSPGSCPTWNGHVAPGNFSTLINIGCDAEVVSGWVQGDTGNSVPCDTSLLAPMKGTVVYVPIFDCDSEVWNSFADCTSAHGSHDWYHISGYAPFYVTGFNFASTGNDGRSVFPPDNNAKPCTGNDRCVSGWFTTGTLQTTIDTSGAPGFGSFVSQLLG